MPLYIVSPMVYNYSIYNSVSENDKMHILIANDDGIFAPGIRALAKAAKAAGHRVTVFAPDSQRSAASHAFTLKKPLCAMPVEYEDGITAYAVDGTPADCVRLGLYLTREDGVDCVLSGINNGSNRGAAILYSGTVGAALEGSLCGVPALAVSLCGYLDRGFEPAAQLGVRTLEWAMKHPLPRGEVYNLNVPYGVEVKGVKSATVSYEFITEALYDELPDGSYVTRDADEGLPETDENSDLNVTNDGYASLSIITWNMLSNTPMPSLKDLNGEAAE